MGWTDKLFDDILGDPFGTYDQAAKKKDAASTRANYAQQGIDELRGAGEAAAGLLDPYAQRGIPALDQVGEFIDAGTRSLGGLQSYADASAPALQQQQAAIGLLGPEAQQEYIDQAESSPYMQAMMEQGENAMRQNAAATGGLRGGNMQAALAQFRPEMMQSYLDQKYSRLGGLAGAGANVGQFLAGQGQAGAGNTASLGHSSAAGQGAIGTQTGVNVANMLNQKGASVAGGQLVSTPGWLTQGLQPINALADTASNAAGAAKDVMSGGFL